jgi:DNA-binding NarL/FixJ family response regulator
VPQTDELIRLVKAGYTNREIARRLGLGSKSAVSEKLRRLGLRRNQRRRALTPEEALEDLEVLARVKRPPPTS